MAGSDSERRTRSVNFVVKRDPIKHTCGPYGVNWTWTNLTQPSAPARNYGLDVVRACAIMLVVVAHFSRIFHAQFNGEFLSQSCGFLGVEIFFVLSGFLIGRILLRTILQEPSAGALRTFWIRRWLRTIPIYWLVLLALLLGSAYHADLLLFLVFLQNLVFDLPNRFFGVAWSLVVEEWFYVFTPVILILARRAFFRATPVAVFWGACVLMIAGPLLLRIFTVTREPVAWWTIRKMVFARFDAFGWGVLAAGIQAFAPATNAWVLRCRTTVMVGAALSIVLVEIVVLIFPMRLESFFMRTVGFSLIPASFGLVLLLMPASSAPAKIGQKIITFVSLISYPVYLVHDSLLDWLLPFNSWPASWLACLFWLIVTLGLTILVASLMHFFLENPIMNWRDRLTGRTRDRVHSAV